jgi:hypothetical protein
MPLQTALDILGEPSARSSIKPDILKYEPLELTFIDDHLVLIAYYAHRPAPRGSSPIVSLDLPELLDEVEAVLRQEGVPSAPIDALTYDDQFALELPNSHAVVLFEKSALASVQVASG